MYLALRGGPRRFTPNFSGSALLGIPDGSPMLFAYGALTLCGAPFQHASTKHRICNSLKEPVLLQSGPTTPHWQRHRALPPAGFGLFPFRSPLLRESLLLSIPRGTQMFQFPRFPLPALCVQTGVTPHDGCRVSPFGDPRIEAWSAAPRGLSQPPTSFIGNRRLGIHRWPFVAWNNKDARARYGILKEPARPRREAPVERNKSKGRQPQDGGVAFGQSHRDWGHAVPRENGTEVDHLLEQRLPERPRAYDREDAPADKASDRLGSAPRTASN